VTLKVKKKCKRRQTGMENLVCFNSDWMIRTVTSQNYIYEDTTSRFKLGNSSYIQFTTFCPPGIKYKPKQNYVLFYGP
jgi:hypothetical protein